VTEEEQISVECYERTRSQAIETYGAVMEAMRSSMIAHNEKVVMTHQDRLIKLERMIERRAEELRDLEGKIEEHKTGSPNDEDEEESDASQPG
jgi:hypothetical protein